MPHPDVVAAVDGAVFPTVRDMARRMAVETVGGRQLMYDDNMTPRWALLWSHGIADTGQPVGWTIAHVWSASKDPDAYTHPANLLLLPESLASLSDKTGPLCAFLRYHAQSVYGWTPTGVAPVEAPDGYDAITWTYLNSYHSPRQFIANRLSTLNNGRVRILRPLMGLTGSDA